MFNQPEPKLPPQQPDYIGPCGRAWIAIASATLGADESKPQ